MRIVNLASSYLRRKTSTFGVLSPKKTRINFCVSIAYLETRATRAAICVLGDAAPHVIALLLYKQLTLNKKHALLQKK
jgi:hypothetical protein